jgi:hypothetical protein
MAVVHTECVCPSDSKPQALAKINNNLSALFFLMSAGLFRGNTVNLGNCLCSEPQILATLNNNIAAFFTWFANAGGVPVDPNISTWAQLAALQTTNVAVGAVKIWVDSATGVLKATQLTAGTEATDTASGLQWPDDYNAATNAKYWANRLA